MYRLETFMLVGAWIACFLSILFIPRGKLWEASFIFLLAQLFSWFLGLIAVEYGWLEYPVRELAKSNSTSFLFEYLVLPLLVAHFILRYPSAKVLGLRILYFAIFISVFTVIEVFTERYTMIIKYHLWKWYWTSISMSLVFYLVMVVYKWFFRIPRVFAL